MRVSELLQRDSVLLHTDVADPLEAMSVLVELQEKNGVITNAVAYLRAVCMRENSGGCTAIGEGMALPHARSVGVTAPAVSAMTLNHAVDWGADDGVPVDLIFMIAAPPEQKSESLQILARLVNLLSQPELVEKLREAMTPTTFIDVLARAEASRFA